MGHVSSQAHCGVTKVWPTGCVCVCLCVCVCAFASILLARPLAWGHVSSWTVCGVTQVWLHMMCVRSSCFFTMRPLSPSES